MMFLLLLLRRLLTLRFLLWLSPEKIEKAVPFFGGRLSPLSDAVVICIRTDVRFCDIGPVGFGVLSLFVHRGSVCCLVVCRRELRSYSTVLVVYAIYFFKIANPWIQRFKIGVISPFKGQAFLNDLGGNGRRDFTARLASLNQDCQSEFRMVVRCERDEPGIVVLLSLGPSLGGASFAGYHHPGNLGSATGSRIVDDAPHSFANDLDLVRGEIVHFCQFPADFIRPAH